MTNLTMDKSQTHQRMQSTSSRRVIDGILWLSMVSVVAPIYHFPFSRDFSLQFYRLIWLALAVVWLSRQLLIAMQTRVRIIWSPIFGYYGLFTAFSIGSAVLLGTSSGDALGQLVALAFGGMVLFLIPQLVTNLCRLQWAVKAVLAGGWVIAAFAVYQYYSWLTGRNMLRYDLAIPFSAWFGMTKQWITPGGRVFDTLFRLTLPFSSSSQLGPCISATLLVGLGSWLTSFYGSRRRIIFIALFCIIMAFLLIGTFSRGAWLGMVVGAIVVIRFQKGILINKYLWAACLTALFAIALLSIVVDPRLGESIISRLNPDMTRSSDLRHLHGRLWAFDMFMSSPLYGVGWGNYQHLTGALHSHSSYLTILGEEGIMGLGLWLLLNIGIYMLGIQAVRTSASNVQLRNINLGLLGAFASALFGNLFQQFHLYAFVWVLAGLIVAAHAVTSKLYSEDAKHVPSTTD